jgi:mediator of RNA polymerase II transcription subunit 6
MSVTNLLSKFYETAAEMQHYAPPQGHSYYPPVSKHRTQNGLKSTQTSRANSPVPEPASQTNAPSHAGAAKEANQGNDDRAIWDSFNLSMQFGSEYMDENPLVGEPGSFVLSSTGRNIQDKRAKEAVVEAAREKAETNSTRATSIVATPAAPAKMGLPLKRESIGGKGKSPTSPVAGDAASKRRRKSKAPVSPNGAGPSSAGLA